jgi:endoglucanase
MAVAVLAVLVLVAGLTILSVEGTRLKAPPRLPITLPRTAKGVARADAVAFLRRYLAPDGRVIRLDQGGDTVSEGQGYAMLLAVATGQRAQFASAWRWDQQNLQQPDGLFAYHWSGGKVVDADPATDADLDTAWALVLASTRFGDRTYLTDGLRVASAILAQETTTVAGRLELVAGPWARGTPAVADPSYLAPEAIGALGNVSADPRWAELATNSTALLAAVTTGSPSAGSPSTLPPNWVNIEPDGSVQAVATPPGPGAPAYGLDAQRVPIWFAAGCTASERAVAASEWPLLQRAAGHGARISYTLSGQPTDTAVNSTGLVAAASAAIAAAHPRRAATLLDQADAQSKRFHTYYGDAWSALGRVLLDTEWLSPCAPALPGHPL